MEPTNVPDQAAKILEREGGHIDSRVAERRGVLRQGRHHYIIAADGIIKSSCIDRFFCGITEINRFKKAFAVFKIE